MLGRVERRQHRAQHQPQSHMQPSSSPGSWSISPSQASPTLPSYQAASVETGTARPPPEGRERHELGRDSQQEQQGSLRGRQSGLGGQAARPQWAAPNSSMGQPPLSRTFQSPPSSMGQPSSLLPVPPSSMLQPPPGSASQAQSVAAGLIEPTGRQAWIDADHGSSIGYSEQDDRGLATIAKWPE